MRLLILLVLGAAGISGCAGRSDETAASPSSGPARAITVGLGADRYLTELPSRPDLGKYPHNAGIFDTLARMNEQFEIEPMLAESWTFAPDTNTYRFHLKRSVRFHDGSEFTAHDVKYTFDLIVKAYPENYQALGQDSVKVVDAHTLDITPTATNNRLVEQLVHPIWGINRQHSDPLKPIGTGPFRFVQYARHDRFVIARHEDYWNRARRARVDRITFQFVPDAQARVLGLRAGALDLIAEVAPSVVDELERAGMRVGRSNIGAGDALTINIHGGAPYVLGADPVIREAIGLAIDRPTVVRNAWRDSAEVSATWIPPQVLGDYRSVVSGPTLDPPGAARLLDAAGWHAGSDGIRRRGIQRLSLMYLVAFPTADHQRSPELIQDQLRSAGIEARIELMPDAAVSGARRRNGEFDLMQSVANQNEGYPCFLPDLLHYSRSRSASNRWVSPGGDTDRAIEACRSAPDVAAARRQSANAIHQLVDVEHIVVPIAGVRRVWVMQPFVRDFLPHPSDTNQRWETVSVAR